MHNLDEKTTQIYDLKINDYSQPLLKPNQQITQKHLKENKYHSDVFLAEEIS